LQRAWILKMKWDDDLPKEESALFMKWVSEVQMLQEIRIPRFMIHEDAEGGSSSIHVFTDASQVAYGAVVHLQTEKNGVVSLQLLAAKARVAPVKCSKETSEKKREMPPMQRVTIPRLELLGCLIGARLYANVKIALGMCQ